MTQAREDAWIETYNGHRFHVYDLDTNVYDVDDIATSLSRLCRYNGHTRRFYSVAEHCVVMHDWVERQPWSTPIDCLTTLHHDDAEYIIGDLARPIKLEMPDFKAKETEIDVAISREFGTIYPFPGWLKQLDAAMLDVERRQVLKPSENTWQLNVDFDVSDIRLLGYMGTFSWYVKMQWLKRHYKCMRLINKG
jgi:hypothetical protein